MLLFVVQHNPNYLNRLTISFNFIIKVLKRNYCIFHQYHRNLLLTQFGVANHSKSYFRLVHFFNLNTGNHNCNLTDIKINKFQKAMLTFCISKF